MDIEVMFGPLRDSPIDNCDPRRRQELQDSRMIQEDQNDIANLSRRFINKEFDANRFPERLAMYNQSNRFKR
jgi:hypothetical protein